MKRLALPRFEKLSRRERLLVFGSLLVLSVVGLDQLVLGPWWRHTSRIHQEVAKLETDIRAYQKLLNHSPQVQAQVKAYEGELRLLRDGEVDIATMLREIETQAKESGVTLGEVKPFAPVVNEPYHELSFDVNGAASLQQWVHFTHLLQTSKMLFEVERASLERKSEESDQLAFNFRLTKKTLNLPEGA